MLNLPSYNSPQCNKQFTLKAKKILNDSTLQSLQTKSRQNIIENSFSFFLTSTVTILQTANKHHTFLNLMFAFVARPTIVFFSL